MARPPPGVDYAIPGAAAVAAAASARDAAPLPPLPHAQPLVTPAAQQLAHAPPRMVSRACETLLLLEASRVMAASAARQTRRANEVVAQLERAGTGTRVPPRLSSSDESDFAASRMEAIGRHVGGALTERCARVAARAHPASSRISRASTTHSTASSSCARTSGTPPGTNRSTTCAQTTVYVATTRTDTGHVCAAGPCAAHAHRPARPIALREHGTCALARLTQQTAFAVGLLDGALERLGVQASVHADPDAPECACARYG